jgi:hypothetical protein
MKLLPRESKKIAGALKSSGAPNRLSSAPAIQSCSTSGSAAKSSSVILVRMYCRGVSCIYLMHAPSKLTPGDKVFTRMP